MSHCRHTRRYCGKHTPRNLLNVLFAQRTEDNDVVNAVEKLRTEGLTQFTQNGFLCPLKTAFGVLFLIVTVGRKA